MAQVWKIRLPDGQVVRPGEWSSTPLYSTVEIAEGAQPTLKAFSYGIGGDVPGSNGPRRSNIADTNFEGSGNVLAENEELLLYSLQIEMFQITTLGATAQANASLYTGLPYPSLYNMLRCQRDIIVVLKIANTKEYSREKLGWFPQGMGTNSYLANTGVFESVGNALNPVALTANGGTNVWDNREFATPHHVAPGEAFEISLMFPNGQVNGLALDQGADTTMRLRARIYAAGYRKRPVA